MKFFRNNSNEFNNHFFDLSPDLLTVSDFNGRFLDVNKAWTSALGWTKEELLMKPYIDFVHPEDRENTKNAAALMESTKNPYFENRYITKSGDYRWLRWEGSTDEKRKVYLGIAKDVTEEKNLKYNVVTAGTSNKRSSEYARCLENLLDSSALIVVWNKDKKITDANDIFIKVLGYSKSELLGKNICNFLVNPDISARHKEYKGPVVTNEHWVGELCLKKREGGFCWLKTSIEPVFVNEGAFVKYFSVSFDITEMREKEVVAMQNAKLITLGEMAAGMAHEINAPLGVVVAKTESILLKLREKTVESEKIYSSVEAVLKMSNRIGTIVKGLKYFSRNGEDDPLTSMNVAAIIDETLILCENRMFNHEVKLKLIQEDRSISLECRPVQISQVLLNLINNAIDAIDGLPVKWIELKVEQVGNEIVIRVTDSGDGIPQKIQEHMMQPFFTTKPPGKGTGLGLSIVSKIVKSHKGFLEIDNTHKNTSFVVRFPISK